MASLARIGLCRRRRGPAGLAVSVALAAHGVEHVVLERDRVA